MKINMIVARDAITHGIGKDNKVLYRCKEDMEYFKDTTMGSVVVMGRKTYESIGKALPGRINIVLTHDSSYAAKGAHVLTTPDEVKMVIKELNKDVFIEYRRILSNMYYACLPNITLYSDCLVTDKSVLKNNNIKEI